MPLASSLQRLTWDSRAPAPFESAANVFLKVMLLNSLSFHELCQLIQRETETSGMSPGDFLSGKWVDFGRYSSLLRVDQARLKQGFLDWLGFDGPQGGPAGIRRCPECTRLGYHCSLFNLALIERCPWHGCRITEPCRACAQHIYAEGHAWYGWLSPPRCRCGNDLASLWERPVVNAVPAELAGEIDSCCRQLVGWWATVKQGQKRAADLLATVVSIGSFRHRYYESKATALGLAMQIAPLPAPWKHDIQVTAARTMELSARRREAGCSPRNDLAARRELACVRRHIFRRFVRPHRKCLNTILRMKESERLCLDASRFCSVCVAYLAWVGSHSLRRSRVAKDSPGAAGNSHPSVRLNFGSSTEWGSFSERALLRFMNAWADIEQNVDDQNLYVFTSWNRERDLDFPHSIFDAPPDRDSGVGPRSVLLLMADEAHLEQRAAQRCRDREARRHSMIDVKGYNNYLSFAWTRPPTYSYIDEPMQLFKIRDYAAIHSKSYATIYA